MRATITHILLTIIFLSHATAQKINIGYIYPAGAQRGSELVIAIGGQSIATAEQVIVSGEGVSAEILPPTKADKSKNRRKKGAISDEDNLQLAQNIKVKITVDKGAEIGIRDLKVVSATGVISNILYFEVGQYPDFVEREPNNILAEASYIPSLPATINGYVEKSSVLGNMERGESSWSVERGGKDYFAFDATAGEMIVAEVTARRFVPYLADAVPGWFQSVISLYDEAGREVAYCDDYRLQIDPVISYRIPTSGRYYLKIHDSIYRGREDFVYRINLGAIPFVKGIYPLSGLAKKGQEIELRGYNLGGEDPERLKIKMDMSEKQAATHELRQQVGDKLSNSFKYLVSDAKLSLTPEAGSDMATAQLITTRQSINNCIEQVGDEHWYYFERTNKGRVIISVMARRLGAMTDAKLTIYDERGEQLMVIDDAIDSSQGLLTHHADPEASVAIPSAGRYYIRVSECQNQGGEDYPYQLAIKEYQPDFNLNIEPSSLSIPQGGTSIITLFAERKYNFGGDIDLLFEGLPEGFEVSETRYNGKGKSMKIAITAPMDAEIGRVDLKVLGRSNIGKDKFVTKQANPTQVMTQAFYIDHLLAASEFRVDVTPAEKFTISLEPMEGEQIELKAEGFTPVRVVIHRAEGFNDEIQIMKRLLPMGLFFSSITIPEGESEGILMVECPYWNPKYKSTRLMLLGTVKAASNMRVAGQARNTINAPIMVLSPYTEMLLPTSGEPVSKDELKRLQRLKKQ